jgi:hypothetical protein
MENLNIGDTVSYRNEYGEYRTGLIAEVASDMDSYNDMKLEDGVPYYASKKLTAAENKRRKSERKPALSSPVYAKVKPKNMDTVFLILKNDLKKDEEEFMMLEDVVRLG